MAELPKVGERYCHYKGNEYEIIAIAHHSETLEELVIYKALYESEDFPYGTIWARPLAMFLEEVEVNGRRQLRFEKIS